MVIFLGILLLAAILCSSLFVAFKINNFVKERENEKRRSRGASDVIGPQSSELVREPADTGRAPLTGIILQTEALPNVARAADDQIDFSHKKMQIIVKTPAEDGAADDRLQAAPREFNSFQLRTAVVLVDKRFAVMLSKLECSTFVDCIHIMYQSMVLTLAIILTEDLERLDAAEICINRQLDNLMDTFTHSCNVIYLLTKNLETLKTRGHIVALETDKSISNHFIPFEGQQMNRFLERGVPANSMVTSIESTQNTLAPAIDSTTSSSSSSNPQTLATKHHIDKMTTSTPFPQMATNLRVEKKTQIQPLWEDGKNFDENLHKSDSLPPSSENEVATRLLSSVFHRNSLSEAAAKMNDSKWVDEHANTIARSQINNALPGIPTSNTEHCQLPTIISTPSEIGFEDTKNNVLFMKNRHTQRNPGGGIFQNFRSKIQNF